MSSSPPKLYTRIVYGLDHETYHLWYDKYCATWGKEPDLEEALFDPILGDMVTELKKAGKGLQVEIGYCCTEHKGCVRTVDNSGVECVFVDEQMYTLEKIRKILQEQYEHGGDNGYERTLNRVQEALDSMSDEDFHVFDELPEGGVLEKYQN